MDLFQAFILALVQGLTEFLPVSSTAHLILAPVLFGWEDQGLAFDVAVHFGTLLAVILIFRDEFRRLFAELAERVGQAGVATTAAAPSAGLAADRPRIGRETRLAAGIMLATMPGAICGLLFEDIVATHLRAPLFIAATTLIFALLLWVADRQRAGNRDEYQIGWVIFLAVGVAQALALMPGTSRSGITMTAALFLGMSRTSAARLSFLMSIPVILLATAWATLGLTAEGLPIDVMPLLLAVCIAFGSAYLTMRAFLGLLERVGFLPFVLYRLLLGAVLIGVFAG